MGTPQYLSPEQARGQAVTPQTDVYSLGVMAYELFLEQLPFEAETAAEVMAMHLRATPPPPRELWPDIPPELEELLLAMLAKQPDRRPTMVEVAHRLEAVRGELQRRCRAHSRPSLPAARSHAPRTPSRPHAPRTPSRPHAPRTPSRPDRVASSPGLARTELFGWRSETRRWQYAIAGLALALSGLMFWISRAGDRAAIAAAAPAAPAAIVEPAAAPRTETEPTDRARPSAGAVRLDAAVVHAAVGPGDAVLRPALLVDAAPPQAAPRFRTERATSAPRTPARGASQPSAPSSPAVPRLRAKVDPDGTLDPYR